MKKYIFILAAAFALAACNINPVEPETVAADVVIEPVITRALSLNFNTGNKIGLDIIKADQTKYADNACLTYADGAFSGDLKWYKDGGEACSLFAYYPYQAAGFPSSFTVALDQTAGTDASDLMTASKSGVYPTAGSELMVFKHLFTQIVVNIANTANVAVSGVVLKGLVPTANVNAETGAVVDATKAAADIQAEAVTANKKYCAVVVPQSYDNLGVIVTINGGATLITGVEGAELKPGYSYTINIEITADQAKASISGEIEDWADGGNLSGGDYEPSFEEFDGYFIYDGVRYNTVKLSNGQEWMACSLAYVPVGKSVSDNAASGEIWYPYTSDGTNTAAVTTAEAVANFGYLYSAAVAFGTSISTDNYTKLEGTRGICPKGWRLPTRAEFFALCGQSNANKLIGETGSQTDKSALFYDEAKGYATIANFNNAGFNYTFGGTVYNGKYNNVIVSAKNCTEESYYGNHAMSYTWTTTAQEANTSGVPQFFVAMTTFTASGAPVGKVSLAQTIPTTGASVRCIKDAK